MEGLILVFQAGVQITVMESDRGKSPVTNNVKINYHRLLRGNDGNLTRCQVSYPFQHSLISHNSIRFYFIVKANDIVGNMIILIHICD